MTRAPTQRMSSRSPESSSSPDSRVDTILTLPRHTTVDAVAYSCRRAALEFINDSSHWGKAQLAIWLMGSYATLIEYVAVPVTRVGAPPPAPPIRVIEPSEITRVIECARDQIIANLRATSHSDAPPGFALTHAKSGFVVPCEDQERGRGWAPTPNAKRLADRVLSLFAADCLTRTGDYKDFGLCGRCGAVEFDAQTRAHGTCSRHGNQHSMVAPRSRRSTVPYIPEPA